MENSIQDSDLGKFVEEARALFKKYGFKKKRIPIFNGKKKNMGNAIFLTKDGNTYVKNFREILSDIYGEIGI